jgi:cystathionine beta-lyase/cystathionine gamma-synthase
MRCTRLTAARLRRGSCRRGEIGARTRFSTCRRALHPTSCRKPGAIVAVDNTFATPLNQRPLALGADASVQSVTKFVGGHSDLLGGVEEGRRPPTRSAHSWRLIQHATSLGAVESTIERRASVPGQEHLPPSLLRLSVGIEGVDDLWTDLDRALRLAVKAARE